MPVTWRAVVQLFLMALRAADRVTVPLQTAFFSFVSVPSLV
jgi:cellulose biosynthesis protein BcsQ